ncbi:hypothetical protein D3C72_1368020 [compost metagenome]
MHGADIDAEAASAFRIVAEGIKFAPDGGARNHEPGGDTAEDHHHNGQRQLDPGTIRHLTLVKHHARRQPLRQVVDRHALGEEHQQPEEDVEGGNGRDDGNDVEPPDEEGVDEAETEADGPGNHETLRPVAAAERIERQHRHILDDGGRDREGDVDTTRDQHHEQADREDDIDRRDIQHIEGIGDGEEPVGREGQSRAEQHHDHKQGEFGRMSEDEPTHRWRTPVR